MTRQLKIFIACYLALRECRESGELSKKHFIKIALEFGSCNNITRKEIEEMLEIPLKCLLENESS